MSSINWQLPQNDKQEWANLVESVGPVDKRRESNASAMDSQGSSDFSGVGLPHIKETMETHEVIDLVSSDEEEEAELGYEIEMTPADFPSDASNSDEPITERDLETPESIEMSDESCSSDESDAKSNANPGLVTRYREMMMFRPGQCPAEDATARVAKYAKMFIQVVVRPSKNLEDENHGTVDGSSDKVLAETSESLNASTSADRDSNAVLLKETTAIPEVKFDGKCIRVGGYRFKLPKRSIDLRYNSSTACEGCKANLPCTVRRTKKGKKDIIYSVIYYLHILACEHYKRLDLLKHCHECRLIFTNTLSFGKHRRIHVKKPLWMTQTLFERSNKPSKPDTIACTGCNKVFKSLFYKNRVRTDKQTHEPELAYYIHCIEECEAYKKLNLTRKCHECNKIFLSEQAYGPHMSQIHPKEGEPIRSWMCSSLKMDKRPYTTYNSSIACEGCGKEFPQQMGPTGRATYTHRSYFIHCVEECEQFKALGTITTCSKCRCIFLTESSCKVHKCDFSAAGPSSIASSDEDLSHSSYAEESHHNAFDSVKSCFSEEDIEFEEFDAAVLSSSDSDEDRSADESETDTSDEVEDHGQYVLEFSEDTRATRNLVELPTHSIKEERSCLPLPEQVAKEVILIGKVLIANGYKFKIPDRFADDKCNSTIACKGCQKLLPCTSRKNSRGYDDMGFSIEYYRHILTCEPFAVLGLLKRCEECQLIFTTANSFGRHRSRHMTKPFWMTTGLFKTSRLPNKPGVVSCLGCQRQFKSSITSSGQVPEFAYYVHCIEECVEYKRLNLTRKCHDCNKIFVSPVAYSSHMHSKHPSEGEPTRSWMHSSLIKYKRSDKMYTSSVACKGCGEVFPRHITPSGRALTHRSYYIHCIEECEQFKALGTITSCSSCQCKFLSGGGYKKHKCDVTRAQSTSTTAAHGL